MLYTPLWLGSCFQQFDLMAISTSVYTNTTRVVDYAASSWNPDGIPPYERPFSSRNVTCFDEPYCYGDDCVVSSSGGPGIGYPSCDYPTICSYIPCSGSDVVINSGMYFNCYHKTTQSVDLSKCENYGFKNLVAKLYWLGIHGYTSRYWAEMNGNWDGFDYCTACGITNYDPTPDGVKYLTESGSCTMTSAKTLGVPTWTINATATSICSVDKHSGKATVTNTSSSYLSSGTIPSDQR